MNLVLLQPQSDLPTEMEFGSGYASGVGPTKATKRSSSGHREVVVGHEYDYRIGNASIKGDLDGFCGNRF